MLPLRGVMAAGIVAAFATWGYHKHGLLLAAVAPIVGFGVWSVVDFRGASRCAEPLRLTDELALSLLAAAAWYAA